MFEKLLKPKQRRTQLHFRDDGMFEFRKLDILDGFLVEKDGETVTSAWMLLYQLQKRFDGYGRIGSDMVTASYDRDIVLDSFNQIDDAEKPEKGGALKKAFAKSIASAKCYRHETGKHKRTLVDNMVLFLGAAILLEMVGILLHVAGSMGT